MGTWGVGNFDNDGALDFVNVEVDRYIRQISAIMADATRYRLDEDGEAELIPCVVILSLLCEECHGVLPKDLDVAGWKDRYLAMFDAQIAGLEPTAGFEAERRGILAATFDRLIAHQWSSRKRQQE